MPEPGRAEARPGEPAVRPGQRAAAGGRGGPRLAAGGRRPARPHRRAARCCTVKNRDFFFDHTSKDLTDYDSRAAVALPADRPQQPLRPVPVARLPRRRRAQRRPGDDDRGPAGPVDAQQRVRHASRRAELAARVLAEPGDDDGGSRGSTAGLRPRHHRRRAAANRGFLAEVERCSRAPNRRRTGGVGRPGRSVPDGVRRERVRLREVITFKRRQGDRVTR